MSRTFNMVGGGGGKAVLAVAVTNGTATSVTATKSGVSVSLTYSGGIWSAELPSFGTWIVSATDGTRSQTDTANASVAGLYTLTLRLQDIPNAYTQLEYIQSGSGAYIDTGFTPNSNTRVKCKVIVGSTIFGSREALNIRDYRFNITSNGSYFNSFYGSNSVSLTSSIDPVEIDKNKNVTTITYKDGTTSTQSSSASTFTTPVTMFLMASNNNGSPGGRNERNTVYYAEIYDNGTLVRKFFPAKRNADDVIGLYDTVNNVFYTDPLSGTFIAGPAV